VPDTLTANAPPVRKNLILLLACLGQFMVVLDVAVVNVALPVMRVDLGFSATGLQWVVNAYTLSYAVFLLTGAALGDRFGRRKMFTLGLLIFSLASAAAALAPNADVLVIARAIQGLGAALVTPLSLTLLSEAVPEGKRGLAFRQYYNYFGRCELDLMSRIALLRKLVYYLVLLRMSS
jgi:MFS family permease